MNTINQKYCPCSGIILADTEDWPVPLCYDCYKNRDTDFLIATQVMGWRKEGHQYVTTTDDGLLVNTDYCDGNDDPDSGLMWWRPSEDIAQAWLVVEQFSHLQFSLQLDWDYGLDKKCGWNVSIDGRCFESWTDTAPPAICNGALEYKGVT